MEVKCLECNIKFKVIPAYIKRGGGKFCSRRCSGIWKSRNIRGTNHPLWKGKIKNLNCPVCGDSFIRKEKDLKGVAMPCCSIACSSELKKEKYRGTNNPKWRGGIIKRRDGRRMIYCPSHPNAVLRGGSHLLEYRLIASLLLGRPLKGEEIVHHVNGNVTDNSPENLEVITLSDHAKVHTKYRKRNAMGQFL